MERAQLNRVLEDQKLQQTGVVDSRTAVKIGQLVGAEYVLVGSVEKVEEEAKPFLHALPEKQRLAFFAAYEFGFTTKRFGAFQLTRDVSVTPMRHDVIPEPVNWAVAGVGVQYDFGNLEMTLPEGITILELTPFLIEPAVAIYF